MKYAVHSDKNYAINIERESTLSNSFQISLDGKDFQAEIKEVHADGRIKTLIINSKVIPVDIQKQADGSPQTVFLKGIPFEVNVEKVTSLPVKPKTPKKNICGDIRATLPGQILDILIQPGEAVKKGQPLLILESMKMENEMLSPKEGIVKKIMVEVGQIVMKEEVMIQVG